jgi:hypothetical protein
MAIVPTYDNFQVGVAAQPSSRFDAPQAKNFAPEQLMQAGQALSSVGGVMAKAAQEAQVEVNTVRLNAAMNDAVAARMHLTYDQKDGFSSVKGQAAMTRPDGRSLDEEYGDKYKAEIERITGTLGNDAQRRAFSAQVGSVTNQFNASLQSHKSQEFQSLKEETDQSTVKLAGQAFALDWKNQESRASNAAVITNVINSKKELSEEGKKIATLSTLSPLHSTVIINATTAGPDRDIKFAKEYFEQNKANMTESDREKSVKVLMATSVAQSGLDGADQIVASIGPKKDGEPWQQDVYEKAAREMFRDDPEKYHAVVQELVHRAAVFKSSEGERADGNMNSLITRQRKGAKLSVLESSPEYQALPAKLQKAFSESIQDRNHVLFARSESEANLVQNRIERRTNGAYLEYSNPERLVNMSESAISALEPVLGISHTNQLMEKRRAMLKSPAAVADAKMDEDDFKVIAKRMGLDAYSPKSDSEKAALGEVKSRTERIITLRQQEKGRPLTREEKQDVMRKEAAIKVSVKGGWFGSTSDVPVIQLTSEQLKRVVVPADDQKTLRAQMAEARKREPNNPAYQDTPENVQRMFAVKKSLTGLMIENK